MRRALQGIEEWQHRRQQEMARVTFPASQHEMLDVTLSGSTDRGVGLRRRLSFLALVREEVKQCSFRIRQYAELEFLYRGMEGWREALLFRLLHRFSDPLYLEAQQADEEKQQHLREIGFPYEPPGEPERQELLRLLEEEIASTQEEFEYAEKANEERAAFERDACLAPQGETWGMMLRQEAALDRSIDRKARILLALRRAFVTGDLPSTLAEGDNPGGAYRQTNVGATHISRQATKTADLRKQVSATRSDLPGSPSDQGDDADMKNIDETPGIDIPSAAPVAEGASSCPVSFLKVAEQRGNSPAALHEMKERSLNVAENKAGVRCQGPEDPVLCQRTSI